uniref:PH domain-containing protein n=1 Tax=Syphacia muris TaxID=451379 RepID=A0A0N5ARS7_9BILA
MKCKNDDDARVRRDWLERTAQLALSLDGVEDEECRSAAKLQTPTQAGSLSVCCCWCSCPFPVHYALHSQTASLLLFLAEGGRGKRRYALLKGENIFKFIIRSIQGHADQIGPCDKVDVYIRDYSGCHRMLHYCRCSCSYCSRWILRSLVLDGKGSQPGCRQIHLVPGHINTGQSARKNQKQQTKLRSCTIFAAAAAIFYGQRRQYEESRLEA